MKNFDVIVIGGGPGGYVAAIRAAQLNLKTALVEKEHLGGVCLNWGCIPTKALLRSAEIKANIDHAADYGIVVEKYTADIKKIVARSRQISAQLTGGIQGLLKKNKVTVFEGTATIKPGKKVHVTTSDAREELLQAPHIIIATGARARALPGMEVDGVQVWSAKHAMTPTELPKHLLIVGSGAIGMEFASFYRTMGSEVTIVEMQDRILPQEDPDISALALKIFQKQGMTFKLKSTVKALTKKKATVIAEITSGNTTETLSPDVVLIAAGIVGNTENLGLEHTGARVDKGQILVNEWCETDEPGIYAIGDVAGAPWLAHKASHEGILCVEKIAGHTPTHTLNKNRIPGCTYSMPQIASIGLTEPQAKAAGYTVKVGKFPFQANGKALAMGGSDGLVKTIFDTKTGELLGAHMLGMEVTELIQGYAIAQSLETTEQELMTTIFPHPTLSEMMHESVLSAYDRTLHI